MKKNMWKRVSAVLLLGTMLVGVEGCSGNGKNGQIDRQNNSENTQVVYAAEYPKMNPYPETDGFSYDEAEYEAWRESLKMLRAGSNEYKNGVWEFSKETIAEFLSETNGENKIYSPINIYLALGMLAEVTDGTSREQVLKLLHVDAVEKLRQYSSDLWKEHYCDDGRLTSKLGASLWLNQDIKYVPETLKLLADTYRASSYQGEMGSSELNKELQGWLNEQTGGLLKEQTENIELSPETVLALATTLYYQAKWDNTFSEKNTKEDTFHTPNGDVTCDFMSQSGTGSYFWSENFAAIRRSFEAGGAMFLFLPDEDVMVETLLEDENVLKLTQDYMAWEDQKALVINQSVPKFDVTSDLSLVEELQKLGVADVFNEKESDFSPLTTDMDGIFVSEVKHAARVKIDEEGCEAAAYTVMIACGAAMPPEEEVDFVLDRPFLFVITGRDGLPLFIGVVNQP